ncbi:unnamed protein product [Rotaria sp. Silwood2]|nr:unnamed protein product [Rotaria sp. Silwood2]
MNKIPHTHDDVGWLKTVDQYYYGARNYISNSGVQYILDSVIEALDENPDRRFIYVEIAYFWRWWNQQSDTTRNKVRQLVNDGRLEFISGGWCMNDEGATHYSSIIDQHSLGAEFLRDQFGECARPKIGWQIDTFGHSREVASLFAQMGFDSLLFRRADYQDADQRQKTKTMEFVWKASNNLDEQGWLFTSYAVRPYSPPASFCFDSSCIDPPIMDDPRLHDYNVPERVQAFINASHDEQANGSDVNVFYSTPSCYFYALNKADRVWTSKTDDFFPYTRTPHGFHTGYYTSRAALKGFERYTNYILQCARQLNALANLNQRHILFPLNDAMGIVQHHDAITGTEKQEVANDYTQRLSAGIDVTMYLRIEFDDKGNMQKIINKDKQIAISLVSQGLYWYPSYPGNGSGPDSQASGAYIFRPWSQEPSPANDSKTIICTLTETIQSALIIYNDWASFEVSLHPGSLTIDVEWTIGPVAINDNIGKEVIMRYDTDIDSAATFYTDANGREVLQRIRDYRPTWNYTVTEPASGNYYPVVSRIWIKDSTRQFTVLTDRSEGGSSIKDGSIEIMLHRRILHDDSQGVAESLNETAYGQGLVVRGRHSLILEPPTTSALIHRVTAQRIYMHTLSTYAIPPLSYLNYTNKYRLTWSALSTVMPVNVHLLTFDQLDAKKIVVRVEHFFERNEDAIYSQPVTFDLQSLFNSLGTIKDLLELTLGANFSLNDLHRLVWRTSEGETSNNTSKQSPLTGTMIALNPMQIRTFQVTLQ